MMRYVLLSILTPFLIEIGHNKLVPPKKLTQIGGGGVSKWQFWSIFLFIHILLTLGAQIMHLIKVKEPKSFIKIWQSIHEKMAVFNQNQCVRALSTLILLAIEVLLSVRQSLIVSPQAFDHGSHLNRSHLNIEMYRGSGGPEVERKRV